MLIRQPAQKLKTQHSQPQLVTCRLYDWSVKMIKLQRLRSSQFHVLLESLVQPVLSQVPVIAVAPLQTPRHCAHSPCGQLDTVSGI